MSAQHTPGPWEGKTADGAWFGDHMWEATHHTVGLTQSVAVHRQGRVIALVVREDWDDASLEADANLIIASPLLLTAARAAVELLRRQGWLPTSTDPEAVLLRQLWAAIAVADGQQPNEPEAPQHLLVSHHHKD
ncbi:hypothetical protein [Cupriavidus basilensis]|uniref:hypothetical protein n=1 Tax=Cupriavidus basilensis TaxID=68895 RepID=UPI0005BA2B0C|nr:hypothetical protein [Cupriavidus basilensis]